MESNSARVEIRQKGDVTILELLDKEILDEVTINEISDTLFSVVAESSPLKMVLSFAQVKHLSSMALGTLIRLSKRIEEGGGALKLCNIAPALYEIFVITKLNRLFDIHESEEKAVESFND